MPEDLFWGICSLPCDIAGAVLVMVPLRCVLAMQEMEQRTGAGAGAGGGDAHGATTRARRRKPTSGRTQSDNELRIGSQTLDQRANKSYAEL